MIKRYFSPASYRRPEIVPLVFFIFSLIVLTALGSWQMQRLTWKEGLIEKMQTGERMPALNSVTNSEEELYRIADFEGELMKDKRLLKVGANVAARTGYYILVPFKPDASDKPVLLDLGFVGGDAANADAVLAGMPAHIRVEGILRPPLKKRFFTPGNAPEKHMFFYEDMSEIETLTQTKLAPLIVQVTGIEPKPEGLLTHKREIRFRNDHLGYAVTWFTLAFVAMIMFAAYHYRKEPKETPA